MKEERGSAARREKMRKRFEYKRKRRFKPWGHSILFYWNFTWCFIEDIFCILHRVCFHFQCFDNFKVRWSANLLQLGLRYNLYCFTQFAIFSVMLILYFSLAEIEI
ncbi:hypothetical protein I3760_02G018900 [Carya illinoinensis]|nr:hypothetical protein I3760_02G018900 [Carya illinoinensis]